MQLKPATLLPSSPAICRSGVLKRLAKFFTAQQRAEAIEQALQDRVEALEKQAKNRRSKELVQQGVALRTMRDRGEDPGEIARLAGIDQKSVRELIKVAEQAATSNGGNSGTS